MDLHFPQKTENRERRRSRLIFAVCCVSFCNQLRYMRMYLDMNDIKCIIETSFDSTIHTVVRKRCSAVFLHLQYNSMQRHTYTQIKDGPYTITHMHTHSVCCH